MSYTHFNLVERSKPELLRSQGVGAIDWVLGQSAKAFSRELKRNALSERYNAQEARQSWVSERSFEADLQKSDSPEPIIRCCPFPF